MIALSVLLIIGLWFKSHREAVFFAVSMVGASVIMGLTKVSFSSPTPRTFSRRQLLEDRFAVVSKRPRDRQRRVCPDAFFRRAAACSEGGKGSSAVLGLLFCLSVSASRLYLQVHYPSDILAGLALGSGWVLGVNTLFNYRIRDRSTRSELLRLPEAVVRAYRQEAETKGVTEDEVVGEVLARHYHVTGETEPSQGAARVGAVKR